MDFTLQGVQVWTGKSVAQSQMWSKLGTLKQMEIKKKTKTDAVCGGIEQPKAP